MATTETVPATNGPDPSTMWVFVREELKHRTEIAKHADAMKSAQKAKSLSRKRVQSFGITLEDFDDAVETVLAKDGGESKLASLRRFKNYCTILGLPVADQLELFDVPQTKKAAAGSKRLEQARRGGFSAFVMGRPESENPFTSGEEMNQWMTGWREAKADIEKGEKDLAAKEKAEEESKLKKAAKKAAKEEKATGKMAAAKDDAPVPPASPKPSQRRKPLKPAPRVGAPKTRKSAKRK